MNDYYATRKNGFGSLVRRADDMPNLPDDGYVLHRNFLAPALAERLAVARSIPASALLSMEPASNTVRSALCVHEAPPFSEACAAVWGEAERILGGPVYVHQSRINFKRAKSGSGWSWHSDFETWHAQDGMPLPLAVTAMIPMEENAPDNGPLLVIPRSHVWYWSAPKGEEHSAEENFSDQKDGVPTADVIAGLKCLCDSEQTAILADVGDVLFFDCNLMHGSTANTSDRSRTNLYIVFNRADNELSAPFSASAPRPLQMGFRK
jgi:ectoine hydroxylase